MFDILIKWLAALMGPVVDGHYESKEKKEYIEKIESLTAENTKLKLDQETLLKIIEKNKEKENFEDELRNNLDRGQDEQIGQNPDDVFGITNH